MVPTAFDSHSWSDGDKPHEFEHQGIHYVHHRCLHCGRDLVRKNGNLEWVAVRIGIFTVDNFSPEIAAELMAEICPGMLSVRNP